MGGFYIELMACESVLLQELGSPECKQKGVAMTYAMALMSSENTSKLIDWGKVNAAITARWPKGLERVKEMAWKLIEEKRKAWKEQLAERAAKN
jgi:hypothetical protein